MRKTHVLLVDDDKEIRDVLSDYLEDLGCSVVVAENGAEAIVQFEHGKFDIVITDNDMPVMCGVELVGAIKAISNVLVVMITGGAISEDKALKAGVDKFLTKPFIVGELELFLLQAEMIQPHAS